MFDVDHRALLSPHFLHTISLSHSAVPSSRITHPSSTLLTYAHCHPSRHDPLHTNVTTACPVTFSSRCAVFTMLSEALLPVDYHPSRHQSSDSDVTIPVPHQPSHPADDEFVRPPDAHHSDILLPPSLPLEPQSSAASDIDQSPTAPSWFRRLFTSTLFLYLVALSVASFTVIAVLPHGSCSHSLVVYITGNGVVSTLLAVLTFYAACSAPVDLSQLAVASERSEPIRWVALTCIKQLLGLADFVFFVIGHVAFFSSTSDQCASSSPLLHSFALASLISGYVGFVVPLLTFLYLTLTYRQYIFRPRMPHGQRQRPAHGHEIAACEKRTWTAGDAAEVGEDDVAVLCSICYVDFVEGDTLLQLPCDVKHTYHEPCITQWLSIRDTCPLCKTRLRHSLRKTGKASAVVGRGRGDSATAERVRTAPGRASLNEIAPFLPGTMAASFSLTAAYQQSHQEHKVEEEVCPSPSPVGTPELDAPLQEWAARTDKGLVGEFDDEVEVRICVGGVELEHPVALTSEVGIDSSMIAFVSASASARSAAVAAALSRLAAVKVRAAASHSTV